MTTRYSEIPPFLTLFTWNSCLQHCKK